MSIKEPHLSDELNISIEAVKRAGKIISKHFNSEITFKDKGQGNIQTKIDVIVAKEIFNFLSSKYPDYSFYCEDLPTKTLPVKINNKIWVIDPLDGTNNFHLGISYFSITISLMDNNDILLSVVYNPITKELFYAEKGKGAFMNGKQIRIKEKNDFERPIISLICGYSSKRLLNMVHKEFRDKVFRIIDSWSPALDYCLLAQGKIDAIISIKGEIEDQIGGILITKEAGAFAKNIEGKDLKISFSEFLPSIIISKNKEIHIGLLQRLKKMKVYNQL
jgi:myo-inositol-1(or 4)-monophosphatase